MPIEKLTDAQLAEGLLLLPTWTVREGKLHRELAFPNFVKAFGFMTQVALLAESRDHHPEWSNVYGRVVIDLTTHDCHGLSQRDLELALAIDQLAPG